MYLSIVITARNDDYGGNLLHRMQVSIDSIVEYARRHDCDVELILVEWNPPESEAPLADALDWPDSTGPVDIRIVRVPEELHHTFENSEKLPLFEYVAKNTGIRRADGDFVLATNPDLIYTEELFEYFATEPLSTDSFYRANRHDVDGLAPLDRPVDERLAYCKEHTETIYRPDRAYHPQNTLKEQLIRYLIDKYHHYNRDPNRLKHDIRTLFSFGNRKPRSVYDLHFTGSGDFTLTAKENWLAIGGYPETGVNTHVDTYGLVLLSALGLEQEVLREPRTIYHQKHESYHSSRPQTDWLDLVERSRRMLREGQPEKFNDSEWGLANADLEKIVI